MQATAQLASKRFRTDQLVRATAGHDSLVPFKHTLGLAPLRASLDGVICVGSLLAIASLLGVPFDAPYAILAVIAFALTFPSSAHDSVRMFRLAYDVVGRWLVVLLILLTFGYASGYLALFQPKLLVIWSTTVPVLLVLSHVAALRLLPKLMVLGGLHRTAVIVGANEAGAELIRRIRNSPLLGIQVKAVFDDRSADRQAPLEGVETLGALSDIADYAKANRVNLIYIALPMASQPRILDLLRELRDTTTSIYFVPDMFMSDVIQARVSVISGMPVLAICETPFHGVNGFAKTLTDYLIASVALLMAAPFMLFIAIGVRCSSPGPILFRQRRYGLDGREIIVYKFRTMTALDDGPVVRQARRNDARITPFGRLLRRTSLDELPQLINVLQGRMSIVGPRPHAIAHNEMYRKLIDGYMVRHKVKPGMTGLAQVNGLRGETETLDKMQRRIEYDLAYLRTWSLRADLAIILRTVVLVLFGDRRAY